MHHTLRIILLLFLIGFQAQSYPIFKWVDPLRKLHNQIDLNTLTYYEEVRAGVFTPIAGT